MKEINSTNWFDKNPVKTIVILIFISFMLVEIVMHMLYWVDLLPKNIIYMTKLEKRGYNRNYSEVIYENNIPRRGKGFANYAQRGIPNQYIEFNNDGLRVDSYEGQFGKDSIIAVFGDSYTDALQVGQNEVYTALAEQKLRDSGCKVDVRNYGLGATGTSVQYLRYKQRKAEGEKFDYVVLTMFLGNDILNNSRALDSKFYKSYLSYPYLELQDGKLIRYNLVKTSGREYINAIRDFLHDYSHIASTVFNLRMIYKAHKITKQVTEAGDKLGRSIHTMEMEKVYDSKPEGEWVNAWNITEAILKQWKTDTVQSREKLILVFLTESLQLAPDYKNPRKLDLEYPNKRMSNFALDNNIDYIDFLPYARKKIIENNIKFPYLSWEYDGHYNLLGHRLLSEAINDYFKKILTCK